ncbi:MAG: hypothetical protein ACETWR_20300 [Anaerolineae bacterium]
MNAVRQFVSRYQLVLFFILTYAISWSSVIPMNGRILPHGPTLAAVILLAIVTGRRGLSNLWQQVTHWRVRWTWYLVAPGIVAAFHLGAFALNLLLGATVTNTSHLQPWPVVVLLVAQLLLLGGEWEEPGWSGYALPHLQERFANRSLLGLPIATLVLGALRAVWHLPLALYGHIPWYDFLLFTFAFQITITWLYDRTNGSVLIVMLFHLTSNIVFAIGHPLFSGLDQTRYWWLFIALAWAIALVLTRHRWNRSPARQTGETSVALDSTN